MTRERLITILAVIVFIVVCFVLLTRCNRGNEPTPEEAASVTAEALGNAASMAVDTLGNRTATDREIDRATSIAMLEIDNAADADDVRNAVIASLCERAEYVADPACR